MTGPIIVTGCQRSGTMLAANILGNSRGWQVWHDQNWSTHPRNLAILQSFINTGRTDLVIQCPAALNCFDQLYHMFPSLHFVGLKRKTDDILASMKRIKWYEDEVDNPEQFYKDHIRFMNSQWGLLKQILPPENWTEVKYNELKDYSEFLPKSQRKDFTSKQWELNKPIGPKYWNIDPYWRDEAVETPD